MKRITVAATCTAALLVGAISLGATALAQTRPVGPPTARIAAPIQGILIGLRPAAQATPAQQAQVRVLQTQRGAGELNIARLQTQSLREATAGRMVQFQVTPSRTISARALALETSGGATVWRGEVTGQSGGPPGTVTLVLTEIGVTGTIHSADGRTYRLRPLPGGDTAIIELNYQTMPPDHPDDASGGGGQAQLRNPNLRAPTVGVIAPIDNRAARQAQLQTPTINPNQVVAPIDNQLNEAAISTRLAVNPALLQLATRPSNVFLIERYRVRPEIWRLLVPPTIDVLVAYTSAGQAVSGDIAGLINLAIEETNGSFTNSNVWARVRLVGTMPVSYNESGRDFPTIVGHLATNGDGQMDNVHAQRDALNADVVVLIMHQPAACGRANAIGANAAQAFVIVHWDCATGNYSFGHEIAHLASARHDEPTDTTDTPYAWGHGFRHQAAAPNGWRTIMGYRCGGGLCEPRLQYWSSPLSTWNGLPMGTAADADNRRVWNERAATLAAFR